jgi:hypothetical protein
MDTLLEIKNVLSKQPPINLVNDKHSPYSYQINYGSTKLKLNNKQTQLPAQRWEFDGGSWFEICISDTRYKTIKNIIGDKFNYSNNLSYDLLPTKIKENIILTKKPPINYFDFTISYYKCYIIIKEDYTIEVYRDTYEPADIMDTLMLILEPTFMVDAADNKCYSTVEKFNTNKVNDIITETLRYSIDEKWLIGAKYPITFDPTVALTFSNSITRYILAVWCGPWYSTVRDSLGNIHQLHLGNDDYDLKESYSNIDDWSNPTTTVLEARAGNDIYTYYSYTITRDGTLFVGTRNGNNIILRKSTDNGLNWAAAQTVGTVSTPYYPTIIEDKNGHLYLYCWASYNGIKLWYSTNGGVNWTNADNVNFRRQTHSAAYDDVNNIIYFASTDDSTSDTVRAVRFNCTAKTWGRIYTWDGNTYTWGRNAHRHYLTESYLYNGFFYIWTYVQRTSDSKYYCLLSKFELASNTATVTQYESYTYAKGFVDYFTNDHHVFFIDQINTPHAIYYSKNDSPVVKVWESAGAHETTRNFNVIRPTWPSHHYHQLYGDIVFEVANTNDDTLKLMHETLYSYKYSQVI